MKENAAGNSVPVARCLLLGLDFFFLETKQRNGLGFSTEDDHLLGQDGVMFMNVLLRWDLLGCHCQWECSP